MPLYGTFYKVGVLFVGVFIMSASLFGGGSDFVGASVFEAIAPQRPTMSDTGALKGPIFGYLGA